MITPFAVDFDQKIVRTSPGSPGMVSMAPAMYTQFRSIPLAITRRPYGIMPMVTHKMHQLL